jgi:plastocyanin
VKPLHYGAVLVAALLGAHAESGAATSKTYVVTIENMQFVPQELTVHRGDRVVWVNQDLFPHTATAVSKKFDSGEIVAQKRWSYVAKAAGEYAYSCIYHPTMKAVLIVE